MSRSNINRETEDKNADLLAISRSGGSGQTRVKNDKELDAVSNRQIR